ncbi:MAG: hypothetical protein AUJ74_05515 [Candidatus Omnitrophica bacterium CG1_02_44_16]|nr:MAG: hypothetical protein AUJ74_05515 [Candidatus Omnitrophica bacterium CG1_02_44_16]PIY83666.1 MAG: hypothetical protein COY78_01415 [Candidatus Omnitrophica bacterium CG_4_10_14_0_8_um_filter_44_12]PIZ84436.1 MAG: hypothetical protein COX96_03850 [Candidatus Omnitrophica bacterium CG_4_10_14_0_2_um_filter_44_9]
MSRNKKSRDVSPFFLLVAMPLLAIAISSFAIYKGVENYITTSNYFKVRELTIEGIADARYFGLIKEEILGTNIFRVDTGKLSERIRRRFPTFYSVVVTRVLPSRLLIEAKERLPVAVLKRDLYYVFDTEGVALSSFATLEFLDFPVITGLENRIPRIKVGVAYPLSVLERPLYLARVLKTAASDIAASMAEGNSFKVTKIDAGDINNLSFYLGEAILVRVGRDDIQQKVGLLPSILRSLGDELSGVRYIDLRPKEPVVLTKDSGKQKIKAQLP